MYRWEEVRSVVLVALLVTCAASAQTTSAEISGIVTDASGARVPGAVLTIESVTSGLTRSVRTDDHGRFHAAELAPGVYRVVTAADGFETEVRQGVVLTLGGKAVLNVILKIGAIGTQTVVTADASAVEARSAGLSGVMEGHSIRELPLNGRDFAQLAQLVPGVAPSRRSSDSGGPGTKLVVGGNRPSQVSFLLDGADINDANNNTPGSAAGVLLGLDTLEEFRVFTNAYSAAYGRSAGGVISAATRSGTNDLHGTAFGLVRNSALDARNFFDSPAEPIPPFERYQYGASVEGPIRRNRTFYLASYEALRQRLGATSRSVVATAEARQGRIPGRPPVSVDPAVVPYLDLVPLPNDRDFGDGTGEYVTSASRRTREDFAAGRLDHRFSDTTFLFARYLHDTADVEVPDALNLVQSDTTSRNGYFSTQLTHIFSDRLLNDLRFSLNRSRSDSDNTFLRPVDPALSFLSGAPLGQISVTGLFSVGPSRFAPSTSDQNLYQWSYDLAWTRGRHSLRTGLDHRWIQLHTLRPQSPYGFYQFNSLTDFLAARPRAVELTLPGSRLDRDWRQSMTAAYVQDDLQLRRNLTLNLGIRYERVSVPGEIHDLVANLRAPGRDAATTVGDPLFVNPSNLDFAPRVGLAWDPSGKGRTSVRAGFGVFFDPLWTDFYSNAGNRVPPFYVLGSVRNPSFPRADSLVGSPDFVLGRIDTLQFRPASPYTMQYNFTVQRQLPVDMVLTVAYAGLRGVHLPRLVDANQAVPEIEADGRKFFPATSVERNPNFTGIRHKVTDVNAFYNALEIALERRWHRGFALRTSYTYSKNVDDGSLTITQGGDNDMTQDPDNARAERGLSNFDLRHLFVLFFGQDIPESAGPKWLLAGWQWNGILTASSGNPFSVLVGYDRARARFQAGTAPQRPDLAAGRSNDPILGGPDRYFDPSAFALPEAGFYGNLGRNTLTGPGLSSLDLSLNRKFRLREGMTLQFRSEFFNVLNHPNLAIPSQRTVFSASGPVGSAGRITSTATPSRQVQFGLRLMF